MTNSLNVSAAGAAPARLSGRSAVFLDEMGIGPLWGRRQVVAAEPEDAAPPAAMPAPPAAVPGAGLRAAAPTAAASTAAAVAPTGAPASTLAASPTAPAAPAAASMDAAAAQIGRGFAEVPVASADARDHAVEASSTVAADDASTAWFDDAPSVAPAAPVSAEAIAAMDWNELKAAAAKCTRCALHRSRKSAVFGRGDPQAEWLVLGGAPLRADEKSMQAISGDAGQLLDNMLQAVGISTSRHAYVTNLVKCRALDGAGMDRAPSPDEASACQPFLQRELALTQAGTVLAFGQATLKGLLGDGAPAKRGTVHRLGQVNVVASFHPEDLLRQGENKAKAWADLCLAKGAHVGRG